MRRSKSCASSMARESGRTDRQPNSQHTMPDDNRTNPPSKLTEKQIEALLLGGLNSGSGRPLDAAAIRAKAWNDLSAILNRVKWVGPGPEPSDDEVMDLVVD